MPVPLITWSEDLPKIVAIPQMVAAGWHGLGSANRSGPVNRIMVKETPESLYTDFLEEGRGFMSSRPSAFGLTGPAELAAQLNKLPLPPTPNIYDLEILGIPESLAATLRDLVDGNEAVIVAIFLYLLASAEAGSALARPVRRQILKAHKTAAPNPSLREAVARAFHAWQSQNITERVAD